MVKSIVGVAQDKIPGVTFVCLWLVTPHIQSHQDFKSRTRLSHAFLHRCCSSPRHHHLSPIITSNRFFCFCLGPVTGLSVDTVAWMNHAKLSQLLSLLYLKPSISCGFTHSESQSLCSAPFPWPSITDAPCSPPPTSPPPPFWTLPPDSLASWLVLSLTRHALFAVSFLCMETASRIHGLNSLTSFRFCSGSHRSLPLATWINMATQTSLCTPAHPVSLNTFHVFFSHSM